MIIGIMLPTLKNTATTHCTASIQRNLCDPKDCTNGGLRMLRQDFWRNPKKTVEQGTDSPGRL